MKAKINRRAVNGILLLDKPSGLTSNRALQQAKRLFNAQKAGHGGTLDEPASGCLPIMFGSYTKLAEYMLDSSKVYESTIALGATTTTGDAEGEILQEHPVPAITAEKLEEVLSKFRGEIMQKPPAYSALKYQGKRMHEYARAGIAVSSVARKTTISELLLLEHTDKQLTIRMTCARGTYVRSLAVAIGEALGCGAHVHTLRRTVLSCLPVKYLVTLEQIEQIAAADERDSLLIPPKEMQLTDSELYITLEQAQQLNQGKRILMPDRDDQQNISIYLQSHAPTASDSAAPTASDATAPTASDSAAPTASDATAPTTSDATAPTASDATAPTASDATAPTTTSENPTLFAIGEIQDKTLRTQKTLLNVL